MIEGMTDEEYLRRFGPFPPAPTPEQERAGRRRTTAWREGLRAGLLLVESMHKGDIEAPRDEDEREALALVGDIRDKAREACAVMLEERARVFQEAAARLPTGPLALEDARRHEALAAELGDTSAQIRARGTR